MGRDDTAHRPATSDGAWPAGPPADAELVARLRVAVGRIARKLRQQGSGGLTLTQLSALVTIEQSDSIRLGDLAEREGVAPSTLSRIVATLEDAGLVTRTPDPSDRRSSWMSLTDDGRRRLADVRNERTVLLTHRVAALDADARATLYGALPALEQLAGDIERQDADGVSGRSASR
jgi:DNA-binding MarR family transcriptional regulator